MVSSQNSSGQKYRDVSITDARAVSSSGPLQVPGCFFYRVHILYTQLYILYVILWLYFLGNIEGLYAIKTGKVVELSEQELVDCDSMDSGCGGGLMDNAYR